MYKKYKIFPALIFLWALLEQVSTQEFPQCASVELNTFVIAENDCAAYIYCNGQDSFRDTCPENTYFAAETQECAFDDAGVCHHTTTEATITLASQTSANDSVVIVVEDSSSSSTAATLTNRPNCSTTGDGYYAHPKRCEYYYRCLSGFLSIVRCPRNYGWDHSLQQCRPLAEAQCFSL